MKHIYARKTLVKIIDNRQADEFIATYHRQGLPKFGKYRVNIGCFFNNELVGCCSFSTPRTKAKKEQYQQELIRMAFKDDIRVVGGASKMIHHYIEEIQPRSFFTYQTTEGELTDVYIHCGMTLVQKGKSKKVLVKNGLTYSENLRQENIKYPYLNAQLVNLGPDNILGTSLGEVYENGVRLTNRECFIRYCDYHEEIIPGDDVYAYENPEFIHYTYKLTSTNPDDNYYYLGRHSTKCSICTLEELRVDGYYGSGGNKFRDWKTEQYELGYTIEKEIIDIQPTWSQNIKAEAELIGELYKTDPNCLNERPGGAPTQALNKTQHTIELCPIHGHVTHFANHCSVCSINKAIVKKHCDIHGDTLWNGRSCLKCQNEQMLSDKFCNIHGVTKHLGHSCCKCTADKGITEQLCIIHGRTKFRNDKCMACQVNSVDVHIGECPTHGQTKFKGQTCLKCASVRPIKTCPIHGDTKFVGNTCLRCLRSSKMTVDMCPIHGETKFRSGVCCKCTSSVLIKPKVQKVKKAKSKTTIERKYCESCQKEARHINNKCQSCYEKSLYNEQECPIHGITKFRANKCCACRAEKMRNDRARKKQEMKK